MNRLNTLPEELTHEIFKIYFNNYVLNHIQDMGCINKFYIYGKNKKFIRCNRPRDVDSVYCIHCFHQTIEYY